MADPGTRSASKRPEPRIRATLRRPPHRPADRGETSRALFESRAPAHHRRPARLSSVAARPTRYRFLAVAHPFRGEAFRGATEIAKWQQEFFTTRLRSRSI